MFGLSAAGILATMAHFSYGGQRLAYTIHGEGPPTVLTPGLLLSQKMQAPLAKSLARRGNQVITLDPLGHGDSDRPRQMWRYSIPEFAQQVVALMDHLELERAVVGGTSLGANISLEVAAAAPERMAGAIIEMPVLDHAIPACAVAFTPLLVALTVGEPVMKLVARGVGALPRSRAPFLIELGLDSMAQEPGPSGAILQGILFGRTAPDHLTRQKIEVPTLVIGHPRDPIHPFSDADMLASELPNARLIDASSVMELRTNPKRLTGKITDFIADCWREAGEERRARLASA